MRVFVCALLAAGSAANVSNAQSQAVQPPPLHGGEIVVSSVPGGTNSTAALEDRIQRLEEQLEAQNAAARSSAPKAGLALVPAQTTVVVDNSWRYKQHNGTWWYWLPSNRWMFWSNNSWIDYHPSTYATLPRHACV